MRRVKPPCRRSRRFIRHNALAPTYGFSVLSPSYPVCIFLTERSVLPLFVGQLRHIRAPTDLGATPSALIVLPVRFLGDVDRDNF
jgi:hypothetical protein